MDVFENDLQQYRNDPKRRSVSSASSSGSVDNTRSGSHMAPEVFAIKASYHDHVIVFRADRAMSLEALRRRIQERFELHESIPIKDNFRLAYVPSKISINGRKRSNSVASSISDMSHLHRLEVDVDWQAAIMTSNGKVTLHVLDF
jgi:predicted lipase